MYIECLHREDGKGLQPMDDVFVYDTTSNEWQRRDVSGTGPAARNAAVACLVGHNKMLLHGGWDPFETRTVTASSYSADPGSTAGDVSEVRTI